MRHFGISARTDQIEQNTEPQNRSIQIWPLDFDTDDTAMLYWEKKGLFKLVVGQLDIHLGKKYLFKIEVELVYNSILVSGIQHNDSTFVYIAK